MRLLIYARQLMIGGSEQALAADGPAPAEDDDEHKRDVAKQLADHRAPVRTEACRFIGLYPLARLT